MASAKKVKIDIKHDGLFTRAGKFNIGIQEVDEKIAKKFISRGFAVEVK